MRNFRAPANKKGSGGGGRGGRGGGDNEFDIHAAARSGDLQKVESICSSNPLVVNARDKHSRTPLHLAAWSGQTEVVSYLCKNKADVGAAAMDDTGAIHFSSQKGHLEVVRALLSFGVSVKAANRKGLTPLHYAAQGSHLDLVKYLVRKGANLEAKTKAGQTAVDLAGSEEVRSFLEESEKSSNKGEKSSTEKSSEKIEKSSTRVEKVEDARPEKGVKDDIVEADGIKVEYGGPEKRKGEENADEESLAGAKKARVSLQHLVAEDDAEDNGDEQ